MVRCTAVVNHKGGVGKSTFVTHLACALSTLGRRILVIDANENPNATKILSGRDPDNNLCDFLVGDVALHDVIVPSAFDAERVHLVPGHAMVGSLQEEFDRVGSLLSRNTGRNTAPRASEGQRKVLQQGGAAQALVLRRALEAYELPYDYVIVDCPPALSIATANALALGGEAILPAFPERDAIEAVPRVREWSTIIQQGIEPHIAMKFNFDRGVITRINKQSPVYRMQALEFEELFPKPVWKVPTSVDIHKARSENKTVFDLFPSSAAAAAYLEIAREFDEETAR